MADLSRKQNQFSQVHLNWIRNVMHYAIGRQSILTSLSQVFSDTIAMHDMYLLRKRLNNIYTICNIIPKQYTVWILFMRNAWVIFFSNNILQKMSNAKISVGLSNISVTPPKYFSNRVWFKSIKSWYLRSCQHIRLFFTAYLQQMGVLLCVFSGKEWLAIYQSSERSISFG